MNPGQICSAAMGGTDEEAGGGGRFPATSWSLLCHLKDGEAKERERHLRRLVTLYWKPVYLVVRHSWARTDADAEDLTQLFFERAVLQGRLFQSFSRDKGSFRAFLKGAVTKFLMSEARYAGRQKRGGHLRFVNIDADLPSLQELVADAEHLTPDQVFDAAWTRIVVSRALELLAETLRRDGRETSLEVFRRYELGSGPTTSYSDVGQALGLTTDQVKHALAEARVAFRDIVTSIVREYVDGPDELTAELDRLLGT